MAEQPLFGDIYALSQDIDFKNRLKVACTALGIENPDVWVAHWVLWCASWGEVALKYAEDVYNPFTIRSGENPTVITDNDLVGMINDWKVNQTPDVIDDFQPPADGNHIVEIEDNTFNAQEEAEVEIEQ